jgi:hypothetical protein
MNHFSYDVMQKQKIRDLQREGMISQSVSRSGGPKSRLLYGLPKLILMLLGALGILGLLVP